MASKKIKINPSYTPKFDRYTKKQTDAFNAVLRDEIEDEILLNPLVGQQKSGDLADYWVHKFRHKKLEYLIAYRFPDYAGKSQEIRELLTRNDVDLNIEIIEVELSQVGPHENFYRDLKK